MHAILFVIATVLAVAGFIAQWQTPRLIARENRKRYVDSLLAFHRATFGNAVAMATKTKQNSTGGTPGGGGQNQGAAPGAGSLFRVPKYSTRRRFVPDTLNTAVTVSPAGAAQVNVPLTKLDQLDIVKAVKMSITGLVETWTNTGAGLTVSPFFPASAIQQINFKLQAAYNSFNQTGPLASIIQAFRPIYGWRKDTYSNRFANPGGNPTFGTAYTSPGLVIDVPLSFHFDEYYDLNAKGDPVRKVYDALVSPQFMAAQARVVTPTVVLAPAMTASDLLGGPVARASADTTSTYALGTAGTLRVSRDAFWTANSIAANPPQYPWQYTRDYFTQPTSGQSPVTILIQNTGVSVGQVMSLYGFVWDPARNSGLGGVVPLSTAIQKIQVVTGGSLLNYEFTPTEIADRMSSMYGTALANFPDGVFVLDFALAQDGGYLTNEECINTYLVNGVAVVITFVAGQVPSSSSTVYLGVEALKMATS